MVRALLLPVLLARAPDPAPDAPDLQLFFEAASRDSKRAEEALRRIGQQWHPGCVAPIVDLARFLPPPRRAAFAQGAADVPLDEEGRPMPRELGRTGPEDVSAAFDPRSLIRERLVRFLDRQTGQSYGHDLRRWRQWMWKLPYEPHPRYAELKAALYSRIDPRMGEFFPPGVKSLIRLDEVDWGGVKVDGIPPLDHPRHVRAGEASFLEDRNVVFGVFINGEARAYPKRILGWHELARDRLGGVELALVYCTLCGTAIPYASEVGGVHRTFGTSGLLYRSNKLMYDAESMSLWSTLEGRPVIGPLAGARLELRAYPVVTTTWRAWVREHPDTTVLSLQTGHTRDYSEGAAYRDYFATDQLMFEVPRVDRRLKNKAEVVTLRLRPAGRPEAEPEALALSVEFLKKRPVHHVGLAGHDLVVVTDAGGANRVYEAAGTRFVERRASGRLVDDSGGVWRVTEEALLPEGDQPPKRRLPSWRTFWFGWYAQHPDTALVK